MTSFLKAIEIFLCDRILLQLLKDKPNLAIEFKQKLSQKKASSHANSQSVRNSSELLQAASQEAQKDKQRQQQEAEAVRIKELQKFASKATQAWSEIERLLLVAQAKPDEEAVNLLVKLRC